MTKLSIIILSYNTKNLTVKCARSVIRQYGGQIKNNEAEIIVVDNASTDGSAEAIGNFKFHPANGGTNFKLINNKENYGFSKGNNMGAKEAKGEFILFLNSDAEIKDGGFLRMVDFMEKNPKIGVLGGKLLSPDGSTQASTGKFYNLYNVVIVLLGGERVGLIRKNPKIRGPVDWVSGASMMVRKNVFEKLKGFDENFFMYIEDMELCYRFKKIGYQTYFFENIKLIHKELGSSNRSFAINQIYKGLLYFYRKHKPYWQYLAVKTVLIGKALIAVLIGNLTNNTYLKNTYGKAIKFTV